MQYCLFLDELIDAGDHLARIIRSHVEKRQTPLANADISLTDIARALDWASRAIRCAIILSRCLGSPMPDRTESRAVGRERVIRKVEDAMQRIGPKETCGGRLEDLLLQLLGQPDLEDAIDYLPIAEIMAKICRDLGQAAGLPGMQTWKLRTSSDIARLCLRAARSPAAYITVVAKTDPPPRTSPRTGHPDRRIRLVPSPGKT